jgi:hypothetical protein
MNTLEQALIDIITNAANSMSDAKDFIMAELPEVIQQLLLWHAVESIIHMLFGLLLLAAIPVGWTIVYHKRHVLFRRKRSEFDAMSGEAWTTSTLGVFLTIIFTFIGLALLNLTWLQIWLAPKVYLIEYAAGLVK